MGLDLRGKAPEKISRVYWRGEKTFSGEACPSVFLAPAAMEATGIRRLGLTAPSALRGRPFHSCSRTQLSSEDYSLATHYSAGLYFAGSARHLGGLATLYCPNNAGQHIRQIPSPFAAASPPTNGCLADQRLRDYLHCLTLPACFPRPKIAFGWQTCLLRLATSPLR